MLAYLTDEGLSQGPGASGTRGGWVHRVELFSGNSSEFSVSRGFHREGVPLTGKVRREQGKLCSMNSVDPESLLLEVGCHVGTMPLGLWGWRDLRADG